MAVEQRMGAQKFKSATKQNKKGEILRLKLSRGRIQVKSANLMVDGCYASVSHSYLKDLLISVWRQTISKNVINAKHDLDVNQFLIPGTSFFLPW